MEKKQQHKTKSIWFIMPIMIEIIGINYIHAHYFKILTKLEDLTVLKRSPDLFNKVKIGQDQLQLIMKHILFYGGCGHFGQVT